jgi:hypothetical protein
VIINLLFPRLVDFLSSTWVRLKRKDKFQQPGAITPQPVRYRDPVIALPLALLAVAGLVIARTSRLGRVKRRS